MVNAKWEIGVQKMNNKNHSALTIHHSVFCTPRACNARGTRAQVLVEYAIVFPIQLLLTLAVIQLAHIFVAKQVLEYSAFCGARAAVVGEDPERAAYIPISSIAGTSGATYSDSISIPGWGMLPRSGAAEQKTRVDIQWLAPGGTNVVRCEVTHDYELRVPVGNYVAYQLGSLFLSLDELERIGDVPHLQMKASCSLVQPWEE